MKKRFFYGLIIAALVLLPMMFAGIVSAEEKPVLYESAWFSDNLNTMTVNADGSVDVTATAAWRTGLVYLDECYANGYSVVMNVSAVDEQTNFGVYIGNYRFGYLMEAGIDLLGVRFHAMGAQTKIQIVSAFDAVLFEETVNKNAKGAEFRIEIDYTGDTFEVMVNDFTFDVTDKFNKDIFKSELYTTVYQNSVNQSGAIAYTVSEFSPGTPISGIAQNPFDPFAVPSKAGDLELTDTVIIVVSGSAAILCTAAVMILLTKKNVKKEEAAQ